MLINILDVRKLCRLLKDAEVQNKIYIAVEYNARYVEHMKFLKDSEMEQWYEHSDSASYRFYETVNLSTAFSDLRVNHRKFDACLQFEYDRLYYNLDDVLSFWNRCDQLQKLLKENGGKHKTLADVGFLKRREITEHLSVLSQTKWGEKFAVEAWKKFASEWQLPYLLITRARKSQKKQIFSVKKSDFKSFFNVKVKRR